MPLSTKKESLVKQTKKFEATLVVLEKKLISNFRDFGSELFIPCQLYFGSDKSFFWNSFYLLSFSLGFLMNKYGAVHKLCNKVRL